MPQYKLGTGRMLLIINRAPVPEIFDLHTAGISLLNWWNVMRIGKFYDLPLPSRFPPTKHKGFNGITTTEGAILCDLHPWWQIYHHVGLCESKCHNLIATIHQVKHCGGLCVAGPPVCADIPVWLWLPVYVSGTLQWISFAAVGHHLGLSYSLCCTLPEPPLHFFFFFFAMLNDYVPARTYLIPGELPAGAKEFSLYISGWCLQKSSDGIWQVVCQHRASQSFTQWLSPQHGRSAPLSICCSVSVRKKRKRETTHTSENYSFTLHDRLFFLLKSQQLTFCKCKWALTGAETYFL